MPWTHFTDNRGRRCRIDQLGLWILCRQHVYNQLIHRRSRIVRETHVFGPDLISVETDFRGISRERDQLSFPLYSRLEWESVQDAERTRVRLVHMRREINQWVASVRRTQQSASHETMQNIEQSVRRGQMGVQIASAVRDLSAAVLVVGSALLSGGTSLAVLGGGSVLRGTATYQDTGNISSAMIDASSTFVVGAIPLAGSAMVEGQAAQSVLKIGMMEPVTSSGMSAGQQVTVVVVGSAISATSEGSQALIEGQNAEQALRTATARFGVDVLSGGMCSRLDRRAFPAVVRLATDGLMSVAGDAIVDDITGESRPGSGVTLPHQALPQPSSPICDASATLITGDCGPDDWVRQIVLQVH